MQLPFFIRKKKISKRFSPKTFGDDVFFNPEKSTLKLRRNAQFLVINWHALWDKPHVKALVIGVVAILVLSGSLISFKSSASVATFVPESCLGGWEATENATGMPSLPDGSDTIDYNEDNSAKLRGSSDIYCGDFRGEIPEDKAAKTFIVSMKLAIDDGTVEHKKANVIETENQVLPTDNIVETIDVADQADTNPGSLEDTQTENDISESQTTTVEEITTETQIQEINPDTSPNSSDGSETGNSDASTDASAFFQVFAKKVFAEEVTVVSEDVSSNLSGISDPSDMNGESNNVSENINETENNNQILNEENSVDNVDPSIDTIDKTESLDEAPVVPVDAVLVATYTLDGENWKDFGYIRMNSWEDSDFDIPLTNWNDLARIQIKLTPIVSFDKTPTIYLDAIVINVEYADQIDDPLSQPDFATDTILSDTTVEDIRVIRILRDGVPMIWYTKIPPPPEVIEVSEIEDVSAPVEEILQEEADTGTISTEIPPEENTGDTNTTSGSDDVTSDVTVPPSDDTNINTQVRLFRKVKNVFVFNKVFAQEDTSSSGDSTSSSEGSVSTSDTDSSPSAEQSIETVSDSNTQNDTVNTLGQDVVQEENTEQSNFPDIIVPGEGVITIDNVIRDQVPHDINFFSEENILPAVTTTEEIVPGVFPIVYTEEDIQKERAKGLEWNFVASGDMIDIASPVDISGGVIFWLSRDKTALYQYNTLSGGISSQSVSTSRETDVKYNEPNGDVSTVTVDPANLDIVTPEDERESIQEIIVEDKNLQQDVIQKD